MGRQDRSQKASGIDDPKLDQESVQDEIRNVAYQLFCECGCEHGYDLEHWLEAERRVLERLKGR